MPRFCEPCPGNTNATVIDTPPRNFTARTTSAIFASYKLIGEWKTFHTFFIEWSERSSAAGTEHSYAAVFRLALAV
jgi:hypothetical protein